jgi:hypothetical protein
MGRLCNSFGGPLLYWSPGWTRRRVCRWLSRRRTTYLQVMCQRVWYLFVYHPRRGWWPSASGLRGTPAAEPNIVVPYPKESDMKRRSAPANGVAVAAPLTAVSVILAKLPAIREFITATAYEDGTARMPGYITLRNRQLTFEATLYDYDSGTRLPVRGATLDECLLALEKFLGVEEAPWEIDPYLTEQLARRRKRGKKGS